MDFDHLAEQKSNLIFQVWLQNLLGNSSEALAGTVASRHRSGTPVKTAPFANGAFNLCYRVIARSEKVEDEVTIMQYIVQHTEVPVPNVLGSGKCAVGPYIVMELIEGKPLSGYLRERIQESHTAIKYPPVCIENSLLWHGWDPARAIEA